MQCFLVFSTVRFYGNLLSQSSNSIYNSPTGHLLYQSTRNSILLRDLEVVCLSRNILTQITVQKIFLTIRIFSFRFLLLTGRRVLDLHHHRPMLQHMIIIVQSC